MKPLPFHPEADEEVFEAANHYEARSSGLGAAFLGEVERSLAEVAEHPEAFQVIAEGVRRKTLRRFPYSLLYAIEPDRIRILAVAHQKRRPLYWLSRLPAR